MKRELAFLGLLLLVLTVASCGSGEDPYAADSGSSNVIVRFDNPSARTRALSRTAVLSVPQDVHRITLTVTGPGIPVPMVREIEFEPEQESAQLELQVPNGLRRTFRADAYNNGEPPELLYTGSTVTDLDGTPVNLSISMQRVGDHTPPVFDGLQSAAPLGPTTVELGWTAATDDETPPEAIEYLIFWSLTEGGQDFNTPDRTVTGSTTLDVQGLQPDTTYYFVARARDQAGNTDDNTVERAATTERTPDTDPPSFDGLQTAEATGPYTIGLGWEAATDDETPSGEIAYLIFVSLTSGGQNFNTPTHEVTGSTSYQLTDLQPETAYYIVVRARDLAGNIDDNDVERSAVTEQEPDITPPSFDGVQTAEATGADTVQLGWEAASDDVTPPAEIDYLVFVALTPGGQDFQNPNRVVTGALTVTVPDLQPDTPYYFVVRARDRAGNIDTNTVELSATTEPGPDDTPPQFAGIQTATALDMSRIQLSWNAASDDQTPVEEIEYLVFVSLTPDGQNFQNPNRIVTGSLGTTFQGLLSDTTFYFVVRARDQAGNTDTNTVQRSATTDPPDTEPPDFSGVHTATATGPNSIELQWDAATDNYAPPSQISYLVFVADMPGYQDFNNPDMVVTGQLSAEVQGLVANTTYWFVVRARDPSGNTDDNFVEESAETDPPDTEAPMFNGIISATATGTETVQLEWSQATDNVTPEADIRYLIFGAETPGGQNFSAPDRIVTGDLSTVVDGLMPDTPYYFVVRARDLADNTDDNTEERSATTDPDTDTEPPVFTGLGIVESSGPFSVSLFWTQATDNVTPQGEIDYLIFVADTPGGEDFNNPAKVVTGVGFAEVDGLLPSTPYYFVVRARDEADNTDSNTVERTATTEPYTDWALTSELPVERLLSVAAYMYIDDQYYVYIISGGTDYYSCEYGHADGRVFFAPQNNDGTLGDWQETGGGTDNFERAAAGVAQTADTIYIGGGAVDSPSWDGNIWYARPETDGSIYGWNLAPYPAPGWIGSWPVMEAYNGYLYIGGGRNINAYPTYSDRLFYTTLDTNGEPTDNWVQTSLPTPLCMGQLIFHGDKAYLFAGIENGDGGYTDKVYMTDVAANGSLGTWEATTPLPIATNHVSAHEYGGYIIAIPGGSTSAYVSQIWWQDGHLTGWGQEHEIPEVVYPFDQGLFVEGWYYLIGDQACSGPAEKLRRVRFQEFAF